MNTIQGYGADAIYLNNDLRWPGTCKFCRTRFRPKELVKTDRRALYCPQHLENGELMYIPPKQPGETRTDFPERKPDLPEWHFKHDLESWDKEGIRTVKDLHEKVR